MCSSQVSSPAGSGQDAGSGPAGTGSARPSASRSAGTAGAAAEPICLRAETASLREAGSGARSPAIQTLSGCPRKSALQQNLWANSGSGSCPSV